MQLHRRTLKGGIADPKSTDHLGFCSGWREVALCDVVVEWHEIVVCDEISRHQILCDRPVICALSDRKHAFMTDMRGCPRKGSEHVTAARRNVRHGVGCCVGGCPVGGPHQAD